VEQRHEQAGKHVAHDGQAEASTTDPESTDHSNYGKPFAPRVQSLFYQLFTTDAATSPLRLDDAGGEDHEG
jgi:hypothetical protein